MQEDGNLCLYPNILFRPKECIWSSRTNGKGTSPHQLKMQNDGNLVIYDANMKATWSTGTSGKGPGAYLVVQDDRNLVVYGHKK